MIVRVFESGSPAGPWFTMAGEDGWASDAGAGERARLCDERNLKLRKGDLGG